MTKSYCDKKLLGQMITVTKTIVTNDYCDKNYYDKYLLCHSSYLLTVVSCFQVKDSWNILLSVLTGRRNVVDRNVVDENVVDENVVDENVVGGNKYHFGIEIIPNTQRKEITFLYIRTGWES